MKFRLPATVFLLFACTSVSGQHGISRWEIEVRTGVAVPLGDFAAGELAFNPADIRLKGRATTGFSANIGASYRLTKNAGLLFVAGFTSNKQDKNAHKEGPNDMGDPYTEDITTNSWNIGKLMAGGWIQTNIAGNENMQLRFRLSAGACRSASPAFSYVRTDNPDDPARRQSRGYSQGKFKLEPAFCYEGGIQMIHRISKPVSISAGAGYFHSLMKDRTQVNTSTVQSVRKWDYNTSIFALELGLHLGLGH